MSAPAGQDPNPKDASGRAKLPLELWPPAATAYGSIGLLEGMLKYGRNNWRATPVFASIYVAALKRHVDDWLEGEEFTAEGGPHLGNALACLAILVDAKENGTLIDDRNYVPRPSARAATVSMLTACANKLKTLFSDRQPKHWDARDNVIDVADTSRAQATPGVEIVLTPHEQQLLKNNWTLAEVLARRNMGLGT